MGDDSKNPSWEEIKKVLDDPNVSDDKKRELASTYAAEDDAALFGIRDEVEPYLAKYDDGYWSTQGDWWVGDPDKELQDVYNDAKKDADAASKKEQQHDQAVKDGKGKLEDVKRKSENGENGGAGAKSGDELLDAGKPGLRFFERWVPLYEKIQNDYNDKSKVLKVDKIREHYNEQRQLNFDKFAKNIEDLKNAEKGMRESVQTMSDKLGGLWKGWTGGASDASQDFFSSKFTPTAQERVIQKVSDAASMTQDTVKSVSSMIREKATAALELDKYSERIGEKADQDWDTTISVANGTDDDTTLRKACSIWGVEVEQGCDGDLDEEVKRKIEDECRKVVRENFAKTVEDTTSKFVQMCDDTKKHINEAWKKLNDELGKVEENPFKNPGPADKGGDQKPGGQQQPGGQQGAGGAGGGGAGDGGAAGAGSGAGAGAGAGAGGGGMPPTPEMPKPPEKPEVPGMPGQGAPGAPGMPGSEGEKVTLGQGPNAVTVQEPGTDGKTQVQLTGPDGQPKTYAVDFGQGAPGQMPGQPAAGGVLGGMQTMPAPGQGPGVPGGPHSIPVQAGPDGRAVIHEGDRTITLEQGPGGEMKVNVDNGGGQPPLNQTIDFGDEPPKPPTLGDSEGAAVGGGIVGGPYPAEPPQGGFPPPAAGPVPGGFPPPPAEPVAPAGSSPGFAGAGAGSGFTTMPAPETSGFTTMPAADQSGGPVPGAPASTAPQAAGVGSSAPGGDGVQNSFSSMSGDLFGGQDQPNPAPGGSAGLSSLGGDPAGGHAQGAGSTGLSSLGGDPAGGGQPGGSQSGQGSAAMGGGMMGGMMGGAQGGQQGGDQERTNESPWRTQGQLFDDGVDASNVRFRSVLGEDREQ
ncbi:hypothetical protein [Saccharopolyspora sp. NPDC049426]|uniref:hypothetical protein n=1 Tax=Saccharopolyspora sp. NPDC049426 TaxID=3155652 RepID=UPI0034410CAE